MTSVSKSKHFLSSAHDFAKLFFKLFFVCPSSQLDYFQTQQVSLLVMCASFVHPATMERTNWTFAFLSDDGSHSSVSFPNGLQDFFFSPNTFLKYIYIFSACGPYRISFITALPKFWMKCAVFMSPMVIIRD